MATLLEATMHEKESAIMDILDADEAEEESEVEAEGEELEAEEDAVDDENEDDGEDESDTDEADDEKSEEPVYTVKVRGQEMQVTQSELIKGYSREKDYTAKTDEVAQMRRAVEAEKEQYAARLHAVVQAAQQIDPILAEGAKTDWAKLAEDDPYEYMVKKAAYDQRVQQMNQMVQERDTLIREQSAARIRQEEEALLAAKPEWADPETGRAAMQAVRENLVNKYGFKPEEVATISNHRFALVAEDARRYHELLAKQEKVREKKTTPAPTKSVKPSGKTGPSKADAALKRKAKNGSFDDKAAYILSKL